MRISLFGNLRISFEGRPVTIVNTNRLHSRIACLILHGDTPQARERLAFMLWPASSESQARTNLRQLLHHLKRALAVRADWASLRPQQLAELARLVPEIREQLPESELRSGQPSPHAESWQRLHFYESLTSSAAAGVLVLGTARAEETGREHPFTRFLAGLGQLGMVLEIPLEPLDARETANWRPRISETARKREPGRDLPVHSRQSAVCGGECTRRTREHAGASGFAFASKNGEEWAVEALHRVQGDLLAAQGKPEPARKLNRAPAAKENGNVVTASNYRISRPVPRRSDRA